MKIDSVSFGLLVDRALQAGDVIHMRPVVEKELLHYDILFCLDRAGLLDDLVFQGGTSLRLCYGGSRFSEDLDFAGGAGFSAVNLAKMKDCIEGYIGARYGLDVRVKEPALLKEDPRYADLKISKWQITITTAPERKDVPRQRIKIVVANIPAYTKEPLPLIKNYDFLPDGYEDMLILTETMDEILADKLVSLSASRRYIRYRDLWDLPWLMQQGAKLNAGLVRQKVGDYKIVGFAELLQARINSLSDIVNGKEFAEEMRRFLPGDVFSRTLATSKFKVYLTSTLTRLHKELALFLSENSVTTEDEFKM
jgi:predicted nucleotidyltransferase component of viral defense system